MPELARKRRRRHGGLRLAAARGAAAARPRSTPSPQGVTLAKQAMARGETPVVLADHSDRSGYATWLLREIIEQELSDVLIATIADAKAMRRAARPRA